MTGWSSRALTARIDRNIHKSNSRAHGIVARCSESSCTEVHSGVLRSVRIPLHPEN